MNSKQKGNRGEREAANILRSVFPNARRRVVAEEAQGNILGYDIDGCEPLRVQVELSKRPQPEKKLREAVASLREGETLIPVAFTRRCSKGDTGNEWLVTLKAEDFISLLREAKRGEA